MTDALQSVLALGVEVASILDVGVLHGTPPLIEVFPDFPITCSSQSESITTGSSSATPNSLLIASSRIVRHRWVRLAIGPLSDGSGNITHSQISNKRQTKEAHPGLIDCRLIRKARLDSLLRELGAPAPYLLKIDVDGHEPRVVAGATEALLETAAVVLEVTASTLLGRAQQLASEGFGLFDIFDLVYYRGVFYQADALFLRAEHLADSSQLRPFPTGATGMFTPEAWYPLSAKFL